MSEKEKEATTQSQTEQASDAGKDSQKEDWEAKYKKLQGDYEASAKEKDDLQSQYDLLTEYVDWDKVRGKPAESEDAEKKEPKPDSLENAMKSLSDQVDRKFLVLQFRMEHPELRGYEKTLIAPTVRRLRAEHPRKSGEQILELAAQEVTAFLETERSKGEMKAKDKKSKEAEASGLASTGATSPASEERGQTQEEYEAMRKKQAADASRPWKPR